MLEEKKIATDILKNNQRGLSLIEILIGLTLLGLAGTFITGKVFDSLQEGRQQAAKIQIAALADRLRDFKRHCGFYPTSDQGLEALKTKPSGGRECKRYAPNGYLEGEVPLDPWDTPYVYESDGKTFNIISYGDQSEPGGDGFEADISHKTQK